MKKDNRPYYTKLHRTLEILAWAMCIASLVIGIIGIVTIDGEIPTHFDIHGNADSYGSPKSLLTVPLTLIIIGMGTITFVGHHMDPSTWNLPFKLNPERKQLVYRDLLSMIFFMEVIIAATCLYLTMVMYTGASGSMMFFTILGIAAVTVDIVYFCLRVKKDNNADGVAEL